MAVVVGRCKGCGIFIAYLPVTHYCPGGRVVVEAKPS